MISHHDAMLVVAKQLPEEGLTLREFFARACRLAGEDESVVDKCIALAEKDGYAADDIVKIGPAGIRMN